MALGYMLRRDALGLGVRRLPYCVPEWCLSNRLGRMPQQF